MEGGKDSPLGDRPLTIKKIFTGNDEYQKFYIIDGVWALTIFAPEFFHANFFDTFV